MEKGGAELEMFKIIYEHTNKKSVFNIPLASLGQFSLFCPFLAPCIPKPLTGRAAREMKWSWLCGELLSYNSVINFIFFLKGNHRTLRPMLKKINSISAKNRQVSGKSLLLEVPYVLSIYRWKRKITESKLCRPASFLEEPTHNYQQYQGTYLTVVQLSGLE